MSGARGLLINITGGEDLTLFEVDQAANRIRAEVDEDANVIFGSAVDETLTGRICVSGLPPASTHINPLNNRARSSSRSAAAPRRSRSICATSPGSAAPAGPAGPHPTASLRQVSQHLGAAEAIDMMGSEQPMAAVASGRQSRQPMSYPQMQAPPGARAGRPGLFANQQRSVAIDTPSSFTHSKSEPARQSLFNTVTGVLRRRVAPPQYASDLPPQQVRREPPLEHAHSDGPRIAVARPPRPRKRVGFQRSCADSSRRESRLSQLADRTGPAPVLARSALRGAASAAVSRVILSARGEALRPAPGWYHSVRVIPIGQARPTPHSCQATMPRPGAG